MDDFSEEEDNRLCIPNELFFGTDHPEDMSSRSKDRKLQQANVRGILVTLNRYKFTIEENTPLEHEIALDPELLGKVFENLIAEYNEETRTTARKATGSYYTPREIVNYMVDESLISYLIERLTSEPNGGKKKRKTEDLLRALFSENGDNRVRFSAEETAILIRAIDAVKILDPACGSGAFPMGCLHRIVNLLKRLDPNNRQWKQQQLDKAKRDRKLAERLEEEDLREDTLHEIDRRIEDIERSFDTRFHSLDYGRKLYLIENCIYGIDIQPIACQIAKLRFFITLIVDQQVDDQAANRGARALPNLETKIVAADTLVPAERVTDHQYELLFQNVRSLREELGRVRHDHFNARTPAAKTRCRIRDAELRTQIGAVLGDSGILEEESSRKLAGWDPYNQNSYAEFFDSEWMFGIPIGKFEVNETSPSTLLDNLSVVNEVEGKMELSKGKNVVESGFDIVIGNPPYIRIQTLKQQNRERVAFYKEHYDAAKKGNYDLYVVFVEAGLSFLKSNGHLAFILPHKFFNAKYGEQVRALLAEGQHLQHIVHFGHQQVFPGSTNYVCLLFLAKGGADACHFVRVENLPTWLKSYHGTKAMFPSAIIDATEWIFAVGKGSVIFEKLRKLPEKLGDVARIWQGAVTSADKLYVLREVETVGSSLVKAVDRYAQEWLFETDIARPVIKDLSLESYRTPKASHRIIFPYQLHGGSHSLIAARCFELEYPYSWKYLCACEDQLRSRESGKAGRDEWYGYLYPKNLALFDSKKLVVQVISQSPRFAFDPVGVFFTGGGNGPYYGVRWLPAERSRSLHFLQALLNSPVAYFFIRQVSTTFRGGYWSYGKRFIEQIPIVNAEPKEEKLVAHLVANLLELNQYFAEHEAVKTARDSLLLGYIEQVLNGLVYELYFPDELHRKGIHIFDLAAQAELPPIANMSLPIRLSLLREHFERIYEINHPVRAAIYDLGSLETVRIIEDRE